MEQKTDIDRQKLDLEEARETMVFLNGELLNLLAKYEKSAGKVELPRPVFFQNGVQYDSWPASVVAKQIKNGIESGQIFFGVTQTFTGPRFEVKRVQKMDNGKETGRIVVMALFTGNFEARCNADGVEPEDSLGECLKQVIYEDMRINAEKLERGTHKASETVGLIGLARIRITE
jgi:hypothetical protein